MADQGNDPDAVGQGDQPPAPPLDDPNPPAPAGGMQIFALAPGLATQGLLDYENNKNHAKLWERATTPLDPKFDCQAKNMQVFIGQLRDRARLNGWDGILTIPVTKDGMVNNLSLVK